MGSRVSHVCGLQVDWNLALDVEIAVGAGLRGANTGAFPFASLSLPLAQLSSNSANATELQPDSIASASAVRPTMAQMLAHPVSFFLWCPSRTALFVAGAVAGAMAKTVTAPLDRVKLMMQVAGVEAKKIGEEKSVDLVKAVMKIGKEEGVAGYWKGNLPQVIRVIPYSAVQLFAYEAYKVTYPLDVLRLRLAVDPLSKSMTKVAATMLREEGVAAFYKGLGPSLLGIAPYIAINFCAFDLIKKSLPDNVRESPAGSFITAIASATIATVSCYPLDTMRRQLQMRNTPYKTVLDAFPGIIARDGIGGLYRGFLANALKNLPNSSIRLTTYDAAKRLITASNIEFERLVQERRGKAGVGVDTSEGSSGEEGVREAATVKL